MTQKKGTYVDGELWLRCPFCGDSERNRWKAHFSINGEGLYYCLRCKASGRLPIRERVRILSKYGVDYGIHADNKTERWEDTWDKLLPGPGTTRNSCLRRFHLLTTKGFYDVFSIRTRDSRIVGIQLVNTRTRRKRIRGQVRRGLGFVRLESSPEEPLIIVEGPYDVVEDNYVCTFGIPSYSQLKELRGHFIMLYPDGDVWYDRRQIFNLQRSVAKAVTQGLFMIGALKIPNRNQDPEDVWNEDGEVEMLTPQEFQSWEQ